LERRGNEELALYYAAVRGGRAAFMFLLQRYAMSASLETSLLWAVTFGGCVAGLAYKQSNR
jgi:hypothetical protein